MTPAVATDRAGRRGSIGSVFDLALEEELGDSASSLPYPVHSGDAGGGNRARSPTDAAGRTRASLPGKAPGDPLRDGERGVGRSGRECGEFVPRFKCERRDHHTGGRAVVTGAVERCERRDCPQCAGPCEGSPKCGYDMKHLGAEWAHVEGRSAAERWEDFLEQAGFGRTPLRHVIVSAPPGEFEPEDDHSKVIARVRHRAEARLAAWSWVNPYPGASVVVHLWRGCFGDGYSVWGPHAHAISLGIDVRFTEAYERRTGWVVKQMTRDGTPRSSFTRYRGQRLRRLLIYELGHTAILGGRPALVWVGPELRRWKPAPDPENDLEDLPRCVECCERMVRWSVLDHLARSIEHGWGMWWIGCDRREWIPVRLLEDGPPRSEP